MEYANLDPIDQRIIEYLVSHQKSNEAQTVVGLSKMFRVNPERIKIAARYAYPIYSGPKLVSGKNGRWATGPTIRTLYGLDAPYRCKIEALAIRRNDPIRKVKVRTYERPISGEWFFNLNDLERHAPKLTRRYHLILERKRIGGSSASIKPKALTEYEYEVYRRLVELYLEGHRYVSARMITERLPIKPTSLEGVRHRLKVLKQKGYIDYRIPPGKVIDIEGRAITGAQKPFEYRFLKGPKYYRDRLSEIDPNLIKPFGKELQ